MHLTFFDPEKALPIRGGIGLPVLSSGFFKAQKSFCVLKTSEKIFGQTHAFVSLLCPVHGVDLIAEVSEGKMSGRVVCPECEDENETI